jgi:Thioredoxin
MSDLLIRLGILVLVILLIAALVWLGRLFVERQRKQALAAPPLDSSISGASIPVPGGRKTRILAFSSEDCTQCHTLQLPVLRRLQELGSDEIEVVEIDALASPELVRRYRVMTVPSTVVLNAAGEVRAVNYGFANFGKLRQQVDELV